ncbi:MAG: hypothetical protein Ct9H300mP1_00580 [Planctomycetaceae bacterium]|nr:MAG: hypothetical protein Ct9H300mP1_00580 [Planctomycetaceae bacterium]
MRVVETVVFWMRWSVTAAVVAVLLLAGDRSVAQDEIRRAATQSPPVEPIAGPAAAKDEKFEQWIYVPYRDLKSVFESIPPRSSCPTWSTCVCGSGLVQLIALRRGHRFRV